MALSQTSGEVADLPQYDSLAALRKTVLEQLSGKLGSDDDRDEGSSIVFDASAISERTGIRRNQEGVSRSRKLDAIHEVNALEPADIVMGNVFRSDLEWEGYVSEILETHFTGILKNIDGEDRAEKIVSVPIKNIPHQDVRFLTLGAVFRLSVGVEMQIKKSKKKGREGRYAVQSINSANIYFRRFFYKSPSDVKAMELSLGKLTRNEKGLTGSSSS